MKMVMKEKERIMHRFEVREQGFFWDGEPFYLASGDIHYFRILPGGWRRRLELMRDFGLTAVETYVPWSVHEPEPGVFDFTGEKDLAAFLELCQDMGFKVLLRPTPYICSETDLGGIPAWLLRDRNMTFRSHDAGWLTAIAGYYREVCRMILPHLCTNGGPIVMVAIENEYGGAGNDRAYLQAIRDMLLQNGVNVPLFTTDGASPVDVTNGSLPEHLAGLNFRSIPGEATKAEALQKRYHPGFPFYVGEFWGGQQIHWGESYTLRDPAETAESYREALRLGYVNFYMFCGGTNWGFSNGATRVSDAEGNEKIAFQATTYDENAPISENGEPTATYFLCRDELDRFLGKPLRPHVVPPYRTQAITVNLTERAPLFENLEVLSASGTVETSPRCMEDLGQNYGYILYRTRFDRIDGVPTVRFSCGGVRDFAAVYQNGRYVGHWDCNMEKPGTEIRIDTDCVQMDVLTENLGRRNYGLNLADNRKGVINYLSVGNSELHEIETYTLPMRDLSALQYRPAGEVPLCDTPMFLRGYFNAEAGVDTFLSLEGICHGFVLVNGFHIGRYLPCGPQRTLYISGELLEAEHNSIEIFDLHPTAEQVRMVNAAFLVMEISAQ